MNNAINNGLLPIRLSEQFVQNMFRLLEKNPKTKVRINLEEQTVEIIATDETERFEINQYKKECLINGFNDIDYLISIREKIIGYENAKGLTG